MTRDPAPAVWRKFTRSQSVSNCVEVTDLPGGTAVRDSKHPTGAVLTFTTAEWSVFTIAIRGGEFD